MKENAKSKLSENYREAKHRASQQKLQPKSSGSGDILISVVVPLYNEEQSIKELANSIESVLNRIAKNRYEVIFVDDGSTDASLEKIKELHNKNQRFHCISFRRNYGKSSALQVGFAAAKGKYVITMDADLQDDPEEIPNLIKKLNEGYDLVSGWKKKRNDPITKILPSKLFNLVTSIVSGIRLHDFNCGLKAYRNVVVRRLKVYGEMHRYIPVLAYWDGFRVTEVPVRHHPRKYGKTKFGAGRFVKGFLDLLTVMITTRFMQRPLHFFGFIGVLISFFGFAVNLYLFIEWLLGKTYLTNRPLLLFGITLIIFGAQLISIGLLGEMNIKSLAERINYNIREKF
ncbi:MAG: glycosyltransferase family 2 protein [Ignavibacteria bacterium]|nr:glycosyltransferase family 2 protein [Ignavibacteria bacterium]